MIKENELKLPKSIEDFTEDEKKIYDSMLTLFESHKRKDVNSFYIYAERYFELKLESNLLMCCGNCIKYKTESCNFFGVKKESYSYCNHWEKYNINRGDNFLCEPSFLKCPKCGHETSLDEGNKSTCTFCHYINEKGRN